MFVWPLALLLVALVAGVVGFGGGTDVAAGLGQLVFVVSLILFFLSVIYSPRRVV